MIPPSICQPWQTDRSGPMPESTATTPSYTTPWDTISRQCAADTGVYVVDVEGVGHAFGQAERRHQSEGRARPQAGGHPASPVARRHELPVVDAEGQRMMG